MTLPAASTAASQTGCRCSNPRPHRNTTPALTGWWVPHIRELTSCAGIQAFIQKARAHPLRLFFYALTCQIQRVPCTASRDHQKLLILIEPNRRF